MLGCSTTMLEALAFDEIKFTSCFGVSIGVTLRLTASTACIIMDAWFDMVIILFCSRVLCWMSGSTYSSSHFTAVYDAGCLVP